MKHLLIFSALTLAGCQSMVTQTLPDGTEVKTPTSLLALQEAQSQVNDCRTAVLQSLGNTPIDTSTEAGRLHSIILSMTNKNAISLCDEIVAKVAAEYNATDRARLGMVNTAVRTSGFVLGGYMIGQALEGIASAAGTRVKVEQGNTSSGGQRGGGGASDGGAGELASTAGAAGGSTGTTVSGDNTAAIVIGDGNQVPTGSGSFTPTLEYATGLGSTSPIIGEGGADNRTDSSSDDDTLGFSNLF